MILKVFFLLILSCGRYFNKIKLFFSFYGSRREREMIVGRQMVELPRLRDGKNQKCTRFLLG